MSQQEARYQRLGDDGSLFNLDHHKLMSLISVYLEGSSLQAIEELKSISLKKIEQGLITDLKNGLQPDNNYQERVKIYGSNKSQRQGIFLSLFHLLKSAKGIALILILILSSLNMYLLESRESFWEILGLVVIVCAGFLISFLQVLQSDKIKNPDSGEKLKVKREGSIIMINSEDILVGDLILLETGLKVPIFGIVIQSSGLACDENSELCAKETLEVCISNLEEGLSDKLSPFVVPNSFVSAGSGTALVIGFESSLESVQQDKQTKKSRSSDFSTTPADKFNLYAGLLAFFIVTLSLIARHFINNSNRQDSEVETSDSELIGYACVALTLLVAALSGTRQFTEVKNEKETTNRVLLDNCLLKNSQVLKTLGKVNCICFDKTGTLTQNYNEVQVIGCFSNSRVQTSFDHEIFSLFQLNQTFFNLIKECVCLATEATVESGKFAFHGPPREQHLVRMVDTADHHSQSYLNARNYFKERLLKKNEFMSGRKRSSTVIRTDEGKNRVVVISDSETILNACTSAIDINMTTHPLSNHQATELIESLKQLSKEGQRLSILAFRDFEDDSLIEAQDEKGFPILESENLTFLAYFAYSESLRPFSSELVNKCLKAGIKVKIFTGDNQINAENIAKKAGLMKHSNKTLDSRSFGSEVGLVKSSEDGLVIENMSKFSEIIRDVDVFYRFLPESKLAIVKGLKDIGYVVAVVGDGANDAPALVHADVGFALGLCGADLAKRAANALILDDSISTVFKALIWGRCLLKSVKKVQEFHRIFWLVLVLSSIIGAASIQQTLLTATQVLWTFFILEVLAIISLIDLRPSGKLSRNKPESFKYLILQILTQLAIILVLTFFGEHIILEDSKKDSVCVNPSHEGFVCSGRFYELDGSNDYLSKFEQYGPSRHFTFIFNVFFFMQIFNLLNMRRERKKISPFHKMTVSTTSVLVFVVVLQVVATQFLGSALGINENGLSSLQWGICVALAAVPVLVDLICCLVRK